MRWRRYQRPSGCTPASYPYVLLYSRLSCFYRFVPQESFEFFRFWHPEERRKNETLRGVNPVSERFYLVPLLLLSGG